MLHCGHEVRKFELKTHFNTPGKGVNHLILPIIGYIVSLLFFLDGIGTKLPRNVDVPLNKETEPNIDQ